MTFRNKKIRAFFSDKHGNIVIAQAANIPLIMWFCFLAGWLITFYLLEYLHGIFRIGAYASILYWAVLEIFSGVCMWRKTLGLFVYTSALVMLTLNF